MCSKKAYLYTRGYVCSLDPALDVSCSYCTLIISSLTQSRTCVYVTVLIYFVIYTPSVVLPRLLGGREKQDHKEPGCEAAIPFSPKTPNMPSYISYCMYKLVAKCQEMFQS